MRVHVCKMETLRVAYAAPEQFRGPERVPAQGATKPTPGATMSDLVTRLRRGGDEDVKERSPDYRVVAAWSGFLAFIGAAEGYLMSSEPA